MTGHRPPVVVTIHPFVGQPRRADVADVLIAPPDHRAASEYCADLLHRYPRAVLVLIPDQTGRVLIAARSGEVVWVRLPDPARSADAMRILAVMFFELLTGGRIVDGAGGGDPIETGP